MDEAAMTGRGERPDADPAVTISGTISGTTSGTTSGATTGAAAGGAPAAPGPAAPVATDVPVAGADVAPAGSPPGTAAGVPAQAGAPRWANLPYALVLTVTVAALAWMWLGTRDVRASMLTVASALIAAAVLRLVLPERAAGLLASRRRVADGLVLAVLGAGIMAAVLVLPSPS